MIKLILNLTDYFIIIYFIYLKYKLIDKLYFSILFDIEFSISLNYLSNLTVCYYKKNTIRNFFYSYY